ncbi:hydrolase, alpha/beta fold family protein [Oceanicola granulosus HTCC2516]|uniref:Hydrolase, alpha/beta fold family protein n=1 Tax=Oceanicola granulosus (strain ATCC BAA-861 / DSM 15982 / KCTC 12143 / HTCC2516) TaxID=314256 RepID=Q2CC70_OCEGH|nr:alpha/beta hydrolase [Oceanicola granulosus]EAR50290.1 hydrolase, alpha/beta fold family protein [Oceanicola granulosus HTCC2516]
MGSFTTSDGLRLHYEDEGDGQPVLCLAGLTRNGADFRYLAPHLADTRLIRLDYRGRGQSEWAQDFHSYNILREGQDAIELLDVLGLDRVALVGTSRGGLVAMALARSHPERLAAVVLNDIGPVIEPEGLARIMDYVGRPPPWPDYEAAADALSAEMAAEFPGVPRARWREQAEAMYRQTKDGLALRYDPRLRDALLTQSGGPPPDPWSFAHGLAAIPTGVIRGARSDLLSERTIVEMLHRYPGTRAVTVPDRGHVPFLDEPEAVALIRAILETA